LVERSSLDAMPAFDGHLEVQRLLPEGGSHSQAVLVERSSLDAMPAFDGHLEEGRLLPEGGPHRPLRWGVRKIVGVSIVGAVACGCVAAGSPKTRASTLVTIKNFMSKFATATQDDPMLHFDCWTSWCAEGTAGRDDIQSDQWNYGPIDKCAAQCLSQDTCTGFMSAHVPFQKDKCVILYNDWCKPGDGAAGGVMFTLTGSAPQACKRVLVETRGDWIPIMSLDHALVDRKIKIGKAEDTTEAWSHAVTGNLEKISSEMSSSYEHALHLSREEEITHHFDPDGGKQIWQWVLKVFQKSKKGYITVKTQDLVQTPHKGQVPQCLPGWFKGKTSENNCIDDKKVSNQKVHG